MAKNKITKVRTKKRSKCMASNSPDMFPHERPPEDVDYLYSLLQKIHFSQGHVLTSVCSAPSVAPARRGRGRNSCVPSKLDPKRHIDPTTPVEGPAGVTPHVTALRIRPAVSRHLFKLRLFGFAGVAVNGPGPLTCSHLWMPFLHSQWPTGWPRLRF